MDNALKAVGCPETKTILPGTAHAFSYWGTVKPAIISFIQTLQTAMVASPTVIKQYHPPICMAGDIVL